MSPLGLILLIVLIMLLLGTVPAWPHSRSWGYGPSGGLGLILVIVLVLGVAEGHLAYCFRPRSLEGLLRAKCLRAYSSPSGPSSCETTWSILMPSVCVLFRKLPRVMPSIFAARD